MMNGFARSGSACGRKCPVSEHGSGGRNRGGHAEREETPSERAPPGRTDLFGEQQPGSESEGAARRRDEGQFWNSQEKTSHEGHPSSDRYTVRDGKFPCLCRNRTVQARLAPYGR